MPTVDVTRIASNIGALNALNSLQNINKQLSTHQARLASGKRINTAEDDPAGLTIATKLMNRSEGLKTAMGNIGDAKNLLAVAESGLGRISDILIQMRNKAEQAASDTMGSAEREAVVEQLKAYAAQVDDISAQTQWNGTNLIDGTYNTNSLTFQTGAGTTDKTTLSGLGNMGATGLTNGGSLRIASKVVGGTTSTTNDTQSFAASISTVAVANSNLSELKTGTYTIRITVGTTSTIQLLDSGDSAQYIAQTYATGTGAVATSISALNLTATMAGDTTVNFGNGLQVVLDTSAKSFAAGSSVDIELSYSQDGSYSVYTNGDSGTLLASTDLTAANFNTYMGYLDNKLDTVSAQLVKVGAMNGRLTFKEDQVSASQVNVEASYSRIMNANMAEEQVNASKFSILQQTATAMLAQANVAPQVLLSLFR